MRKLLFVIVLSLLLGACGEEGVSEWGSCNSSGDCAGDLVCKNGVCVQPETRASCFVDDQCPDGYTCLAGVCSDGNVPPPECTDTNPCGEGFSCVKEQCVDNGGTDLCDADAECPDGQTCQDGKCEDGSDPECTTGEDCESGNCDEDAGLCLGASCEDDAECDDEFPCTEDACQDGACVNSFVAGEGCCQSDDDCVTEDPCQTTSCVDLGCESEPIANCCVDDAQCDDGNFMTDDLCEDNLCANPGIDCVFDADCDDGNACSVDKCPSSHQCENTATADPLCCADDEDCHDGDDETKDICVNFQCQFKSENCEQDVDCVDSNPCTTEWCDQGICQTGPVTEPQCECESDGDCLGKGNCCKLYQLGISSYGLYCGEPVGPKLAGESCTESAECKSGDCVELNYGEICFGGCKSDMDCKGESICGTIGINLGGDQKFEVAACVAPPPGCKGDSSCAEGTVCLPGQHPDLPNTILGFCGPPTGSKTGGSICSADSECQTGNCIDLFEKEINICWATCATDENCLPGLYCYENLVYFGFDQGTPDEQDDKYFSPGTCAPLLGSFQTCWADTDCPGSEYCNLYSDTTWTALEPRCVSSKGNVAAGGSCSSDTQCKSNDCIMPAGLCFGLCKANGDCSGGTTCQLYEDYPINPKGDTTNIHLCLP